MEALKETGSSFELSEPRDPLPPGNVIQGGNGSIEKREFYEPDRGFR
jgi:hypothetical protein